MPEGDVSALACRQTLTSQGRCGRGGAGGARSPPAPPHRQPRRRALPCAARDATRSGGRPAPAACSSAQWRCILRGPGAVGPLQSEMNAAPAALCAGRWPHRLPHLVFSAGRKRVAGNLEIHFGHHRLHGRGVPH
eukprot:scaffold181443_cov33-Tisochrysis_lutea.AAC.4